MVDDHCPTLGSYAKNKLVLNGLRLRERFKKDLSTRRVNKKTKVDDGCYEKVVGEHAGANSAEAKRLRLQGTACIFRKGCILQVRARPTCMIHAHWSVLIRIRAPDRHVAVYRGVGRGGPVD